MKKGALIGLFLVVMTGAAQQAVAENGTLSITAGYRERIALPPGAVLEVELLDVSRADAPSVRISSQRFSMNRSPLSVILHYDTEVIDQRMSYSVAARIMSGDRVLFRTTSSYPSITRGAPRRLELVLQKMAGERETAPISERLSGVPWASTEIGGRAVSVADPPMIVFEENGTFSLFAGCNRFRGKASVSSHSLVFPEALAGTRRACARGIANLERSVLEALTATAAFQRLGSSLNFLDATGLVTMRFKQRPE